MLPIAVNKKFATVPLGYFDSSLIQNSGNKFLIENFEVFTTYPVFVIFFHNKKKILGVKKKDWMIENRSKLKQTSGKEKIIN